MSQGTMGNEAWAAVPHLTTALTGPLLEIEAHLLQNQAGIERWFRSQWQYTPAPFYCSVDLRNAGFKLAPVDTNLFPAGFNNLNPAFLPPCVQAVQAMIEKHSPAASGVLVVAESHTRNVFYFESLAVLTEILARAGLRVRVGSLLPDLHAPRTMTLPSGRALTPPPPTPPPPGRPPPPPGLPPPPRPPPPRPRLPHPPQARPLGGRAGPRRR